MRHSPTAAERAMGRLLHRGGYRFSKQQVFYDSKKGRAYIADFYLWEEECIIECDGPYHISPWQVEKDWSRDRDFIAAGIVVVRVTNQAALGMRLGDLRDLLGMVY
jgi:very-short-patch-repair endonuclease